MSGSWKLTLPCNRAEAEYISGDVPSLSLLDPEPVIVTSEVDEDADIWQMDAYFEAKPSKAVIAVIQGEIPSAAKAKPVLEKMGDEDWVTMSQAGIEPVHAGRFYVHTAENKGDVPEGAYPLRIDAGLAFGTGTHETTAGCLAMLDRLKASGNNFRYIVDIGTGTGLLAFAALHLWPKAYATASDIDPISIDVTRDNAAINGVKVGQEMGAVALCVASGTDHEMIRRRAPYDLVIANILAGPLIELAPSIAEVIAPGGTLILAGLLDRQQEAVARAYRAQGFRLAQSAANGDWPSLRLVKRQKVGWQRPVRASGRTSQPPGDFGSW